MAHVMTEKARQAFEWAVKHATPNTKWALDGPPNSKSIVYFRVLGYESIGDPEDGCTLEIGNFRFWAQGRLQRVAAIAHLPAWFLEAQDGKPSLITAVRFKELADNGILSESAMRV